MEKSIQFDFLGSCDSEDGKDLKAVIKNVLVKKVKNTDGKEQDRNVAYFTDSAIKPMVLNATNCKVVKKFAKSPYINDWNNIPVQIYIKDDVRAWRCYRGFKNKGFSTSNAKTKLSPSSPAWNHAVTYLKGAEQWKKLKRNTTYQNHQKKTQRISTGMIKFYDIDQNSEQWDEVRRGKFTASSFSDLFMDKKQQGIKRQYQSSFLRNDRRIRRILFKQMDAARTRKRTYCC